MSQYAKEINRILASLNGQEDEDTTPLPEEEGLDTIHVYPVEGGGLLLTRTPLEDDEAAPVIDSRPTRTVPRTPPFVLFLLLLCLFQVGDLADNQWIAMMIPTATIAITPEVHTIRLQSTAILGRLLSPVTLSESQTVPATGHGHQDARAATGTLAFYNGELQSVTVAAGTVLTGQDGVQVATTQGAVIPAADPTTAPPTFGQVTVAAQAVRVGAAGDIAAYDVSETCCAASVLAKNLTAFTGGQDEQDYLVVTQADRDRAADSLQSKVSASMSAALQQQLLPGQVLHPLPCSPAITADHALGQEATFLTVTVSETCTAVAFDMQQLQAKAMHLLTAQAAHTFGAGYLLASNVQVTVSKAVSGSTTPVVTLTFICTGTFAYTLTAQAQQHLKTLLADQPRLTALRLLSQQPGIHEASISGISDNQLLPDDLSHIHLLLVVPLW